MKWNKRRNMFLQNIKKKYEDEIFSSGNIEFQVLL